ncbi:winged helix-turn-helix domain-containing protein [Dokdonella sp.]|uniref:winged helix-turn-helix domain-containing protein n=1 Tax=Dokdonella sp. TaxID=2291710 RepID=UPI001B1DD64B|nr:winged helix-turn-helix domain-containing protein [Dokdonella sp.]MBO9663303.1 winged helix-turn-helix domain-containing protein [Dokdonella sp.]
MARRLRFGSHLIDLATRELSDDGRLLQLSPRVFDCIAYLIEHRDRAVGRDELMAALWGKTDVADTQLAQIILRARRAAGDSGEAQQAIRTVAGFGYRWVAETGEEEEAPAPTDPPGAPAAAPSPAPASDREYEDAVRPAAAPPAAAIRPSPRWPAILAIALLALVAAAGLAWFRFADEKKPIAAPAPTAAAAKEADRAIAVLPATVDAADEWDWLRLGAMEFVAGRLRKAGQTVTPSENVISVMRSVADAKAMPAALKAALDPRWIVVPTMRKSDSGWIARLELGERSGKTREFQGDAADPMVAARIAAERLLGTFGQAAEALGETPAGPAEALLSRVDAALLVDDVDGARRLLAGTSDAMRATPEVRLRQASIDFTVGRNDAAAQALEALLPDVPAETDPLLRARIVSQLGAAHIRMGRAAEAEEETGAALALLKNLDAPALLGKAYMRRGVARSLLGRNDDALADFAQARIAMQLAGDTLGIALVELNEGALNGLRSHPADALASFVLAEKHFERLGVQGELANAVTNQVLAHRLLLEPDEGLAASERSLSLLGHLASIEATHLVQIRRAQALVDVGRWSEAGTQLDELSRAVDRTREAEIWAMSDTERARIELERGRPQAALDLAEPVVETLLAPDFAATRQEAWSIAIRALLLLDRERDAAEAVATFAAWADDSGNPRFVVHARLAQAELAQSAHRVEDAEKLYADALALANRNNVPVDTADVAIAYGEALIARGELERAVPVVGLLDRYATRSYPAAVLQARLYRALGHTEAWRSALAHARALAGERPFPAELSREPIAIKTGVPAG